ncbi:aspartate/glutamate racemase family protein [Parendozoicomonas haliclonae]|uniref:Glutamate racemase n=1 Tax=Parendozoicomonas haliclonae TaxID=1960125 RepID=A0A1X7ARQ7_9GAMM|nr:aspartate/glutamate racemase family protein [Parendozoicomonas haliclonae]SMA50822.1 glutamate racemase [Parendozoicomonas haliclonae]
MPHIQIINPSSDRAFTLGIAQVLKPLERRLNITLEFATLEQAPLAIDTQYDIDSVSAPVCDLIRSRKKDIDAAVIACFADPGVSAARELFTMPVIGCCEAALSLALNMGERFGIISTRPEAYNAELRQIRGVGLEKRLAGVIPAEIPTAQMMSHSQGLETLIDRGRQLKAMGAESIVLGCAGMASYSKKLEDALNMPVIEPVTAGLGMAVTRLAMRAF